MTTGEIHSTPSITFDELMVHIKLVILATLGFLVLYALPDEPYIAILSIDISLCTYLSSLFKTRHRYLFFLHPLILLISSQLFSTPFLVLGDGVGYKYVVAQYLDMANFTFEPGYLLKTYGLLGFFKYASLGVTPVYSVPEYFFTNPPAEIYYLWQGTFHVALCAVVVSLARSWRTLDGTYLFAIALFSVVSPSFFDLGAAPTRHIMTFFGVFLLLIAHLAVVQKLTITRMVWFAMAVTMILISKAPLLLPYMIFAFIDLCFIKRIKLDMKSYLLLGMLAFGAILIGGYLYQTILVYEAIGKGGAATFSNYTQLPLIGWLIKYVYALLAPFPWSEAPLFIATTYGGNWLLFFMHTLSALTGLYLFLVVILRWRVILASNIELKQMVAYGAIMSLSILKGSTGFHTYLLIYFPMLIPLLTIRKFRINPLIPVVCIVCLESILLVYK